MPLVEQPTIDRHDGRFAALNTAAFASKHLYNAALYLTRQAFIHKRRVVSDTESAPELRTTAAYCALPRNVSQWVLKHVAFAWKGPFAACSAWEANPSRLLDHPKLPRYLDKLQSRTDGHPRAGHGRALLRASSGKSLNAGVNGAHNVMSSVAPDACGNGIAGVVVHPARRSRWRIGGMAAMPMPLTTISVGF